MNLERNFNLTNATFTITNTRMTDSNTEKLIIQTQEGNTFIYIQRNSIVGNDRDNQGCIGSAGYSRNEEAQECQRSREH